MTKRLSVRMWIRVLVVGLGFGGATDTDAMELNVATQFGLTYLPLMIMQEDRLIERHARELGISALEVKWGRFASGSVMNDALLSGRLDIVPASVPAFLTLWNKTRGTANAVIGICALNSLPLFLNTRNAAVKGITDFSERDKIALAAVKVSTFAIALQMEAAKIYGDAHYDRFDKWTVSLPHPEGMAALMSGVGEVNSHFTSPPYNFQELEDPKIRSFRRQMSLGVR